MSSKKRKARAKQIDDFKAQLGCMDDAFLRAERHRDEACAQREAALRYKACESKNRYGSRAEAEATIVLCEEYGTAGLHTYPCPYCGGWHLTSKP